MRFIKKYDGFKDNYLIENFDKLVYDYIYKNINESLQSDFEENLEEIKRKKLGEYNEEQYRINLINLILYTSKIENINDKLGSKLESEGHKGGLIKSLTKLLEKCVEYSYIDTSIDEYSKYLTKDLTKSIRKIKDEIVKLEKDLSYKDYNKINYQLELLKTIINRFAEYGVISKIEAINRKFSKDDIGKVANLNFYIQDVILPLTMRCFNISYWLLKNGYASLNLMHQHASDEEISIALDKCLKDVPINQMGKLLYFSEGNEKLSNQVYIFSLPAGKTCSNAINCKTTVIVDDIFRKASLKKLAGNKYTCYAASGQSIYPSKYYKAMVNFKILNEYCKNIEDKTTVLKTMVDGFSHNSIIRVHDAGDFFSSDYLNAWLNVADLNPDKLFYAYTTSIVYLKKVADKRGYLPMNFVFTESEENLTRLFNDKADEIVQSIKDIGVLKTRKIFKTFKEAEEHGVIIDVNDTLAMNPEISEFGLLLHGGNQPGIQKIYADKFSMMNNYPDEHNSLIKLYYKLPLEYRKRIDDFYDDLSYNSTDKMKNYLEKNFSDIKNYISDNNIKTDRLDIKDILDKIKTKKDISKDKYDLLQSFITKELLNILNVDKKLSKDEAKKIIMSKIENVLELI